jgi:predicted DNA-binding transcriptional regulator YafY
VQRFERIIGILLFLRAGGRLTAGELASRFDVSARTIYRDLEVLSQLGVPVYTERGRGGGIRLSPGFFLPPVTFTRDEAMSLVAGLALLASLRVVPFSDGLDTARRKLLAAVPDDLRAVLAGAERVLGFEAPPNDIFHPEPVTPDSTSVTDERLTKTVSTFAEAIFQRRRAHLRYRSPYHQTDATIEIDPLGLFWDRQRWYLVGAPTEGDGRSRDRRLFRADRVRHLSLGARTERATAFDIRSLLNREWLRHAMADWAGEQAPVIVRISAGLHARLLDDWYYRFASYEPLPGGQVLMMLGEVDRGTVFEFVRWLGPEAELLEPAEWRSAFAADLASLASRYG